MNTDHVDTKIMRPAPARRASFGMSRRGYGARLIGKFALSAALIVALSFGCAPYASATESAAGPQPPPSVKFADIPDAAFEDKINNAAYYEQLFPEDARTAGAGKGAAGKNKGALSPLAVTWSDLREFNWRTDWNNADKLAQRPRYSPVFPTRDQGEFGSCWAFASLAAAEGGLVMNGVTSNAEANRLSPYHLVFSAYNSATFATDVTSDDDMDTFAKAALNSGGNADMAGSAMSKWFGPMPESQYPYPTSEDPSAITSLAELQQSKYHLQNTLNFPSPNDEKTGVAEGKGEATVIPSQLNAIKSALYTYGPLSTSYSANDLDDYEETGVYYGDAANGSTTYYQTDDSSADHAVLMVGWDDDFPAEAFNDGSGATPKGDGAFLIQNTWGADWGDGGGFFWLSYYDPSIGVSTYFSLYDTENSDDIYYWDDVGYAGAGFYNLSWYASEQISTMANVFTVSESAAAHSIEAAGVYCPSPGTRYEISVYKNPPKDVPSGGTALPIGDNGSTTVSYTAKFAGYHTILFSVPQHLNAGDTFAVVARVLNNNTDGSALTCEGVLYDYGTEEDHVTISPGQSYYSSDGKRWTDLSSTYAEVGSNLGNFNLRAYTSGVGVSSVEFSADYPVQKVYKVGEAFNYAVGKIEVIYADGVKEYISLSDPGITITGFDSGKPGAKTVRITYLGRTLSYAVSVITWTSVTGLSDIKGAPAKYFYNAKAKTHDISLSASVSPAGATDKGIVWSVIGPAVIASTGTSSAKLTFTGKEGLVVVTAKDAESGRYFKSARILSARKVTSIVSPLKTVYLKKNSTYKLPCVAYNGNLTAGSSLTFVSSKPKTLSILGSGKLKAHSVKKKTKVIVTVTAFGGYKKKFTVYVMPKAKKLKSVKLTGVPSKLKKGAYKQLKLKPGTSSATNLTPKFKSSKPGVLTVDGTGKIFAKSKGKARVTVSAGGKKAVTKYIRVY